MTETPKGLLDAVLSSFNAAYGPRSAGQSQCVSEDVNNMTGTIVVAKAIHTDSPLELLTKACAAYGLAVKQRNPMELMLTGVSATYYATIRDDTNRLMISIEKEDD